MEVKAALKNRSEKEMRSKGIILETCRSLEKRGFKAVKLEYRPVGDKKSIDLLATKNRKFIVIRSSENAVTISRVEAEELKTSADLIRATPLIVSRKIHTRSIEEDVMYVRHTVPTISPQGLEKLLSREVFVVSDRGGYYVEINGEALRRAREDNNLSLGELAKILGVSRKAVYMYERGEMRASIPVALKIMELFGEEVLKPLSIEELHPLESEEPAPMPTPDVKAEQKLMSRVKNIGFQPLHFRTTPIDIIVRDEETQNTLLFTIEHSPRDFLESKLEATLKISQKTGFKTVVLASKVRLRRLEGEVRGSWSQIAIEDVEKLSEKDLA